MSSAQTHDEWTSVPSRKTKKSSRSSQAQPHSHPNLNKHLIINSSPPPISRDLTLSDLTRDFEARMKQWKKTDCRKELRKLMSWVRDARGSGRLDKFICLGSGSLSRENVECRRRSLWQVVVWWDLVGWVEDQRQEGGIEEDDEEERGLWVSDPAYTELDKEFFKTLGVKVVDVDKGARGLGEVKGCLGGRTLLFEPFVDMNAEMMRDLVETDVGIYVGSSVGGLKEREGEVGALAKRFGQDRTMRKFPAFEVDPNVFDGMGIYWKEESDD